MKGIEQVLVTANWPPHAWRVVRHFDQFGDLLAAVDAAVTPQATY
jgi:UDP-N-acetylmuramoyl-tripeptide--D-alanyl-D-alanine ligase